MENLAKVKCPSCSNRYNNTNRCPKSLPQCSHTVCQSCLDQIQITENPQCPFDQKPFLSLQKIETNFGLLEIVEAVSQYEECPIHQDKPLVYICEQENTPICNECFFKGQHKGHPVQRIEDLLLLQEEEAKSKKVLTKSPSLAEKHCLQMQSVLEKRKLADLEQIDESFDELETILKRKKFEARYLTIQNYDTIKKNLTFEPSHPLQLQRSFSQPIPSFPDLNDPCLWDQINEPSYVKPVVAEVENNSLALATPQRSQEKTPVKHMQLLNLLHHSAVVDSMKVKSRLQIQHAPESGSLMITLGSEKNEETVIDIKAWRNTTKVYLFCLHFDKEDFAALHYIFSQLYYLRAVTISDTVNNLILNDKGLDKNLLQEFLSIVFYHVKKLQFIDFNWSGKKHGAHILKFLVEKTLPRIEADSLKVLKINLQGKYDLNGIIGGLFYNVRKFKTSLEKFVLRMPQISARQLLGAPVIELCKLKEFAFEIDCERRLEKAVQTFLLGVLSQAKHVNTLCLELLNCWIKDHQFKGIFNVIEKKKNLRSLSILIDENKFGAQPYIRADENDYLKLMKFAVNPISRLSKLEFLSFGFCQYQKDVYTQARIHKFLMACDQTKMSFQDSDTELESDYNYDSDATIID